jgi:phage I-like protein
VAALTARLNGDQVLKTVDEAIAANKLTAGQRDQYIELGTKDFAMLTAVLAVTPVIPGLNGQSPGAAGDQPSGVAALTATQLGIARQLGLDPEAYAKTLKAAA